MQIREQLESLVEAAIAAAIEDGSLALEKAPAPALERPRDAENGDWASTVAMRSAKLAHANPRAIAAVIADHLSENDVVASVEVAGPGFINFRLTACALQGVVADVRAERSAFGRGSVAECGRKVNLEYISANPTGPMHIGHGRWAALGDSMARVMRHAGYEVSEEFYVNDHGTQMDVFANSIAVRYLQLLGHDVQMPEECYGGAYVTDIARGIVEREGAKYEDMPEDDRRVALREIGYAEMLENQRRLLERFGTTFDTWFSERWLYELGDDGRSAVERALAVMRERGYVYEAEGATWFRSTAFGDDKDRVLVKANGELTYFTSDMAYHYDKLQRGFDLLIDIWGADHHGYIKRCEAMMEAWGHAGELEVVLGQLVNLLRDGVPVRMSKRTGEMVTFEELVDEVGVDATRFLMLSRSSDQPVDFDIEVAKKQDASNPVYYVQYAHARICSVLRKAAAAEGIGASAGAAAGEGSTAGVEGASAGASAGEHAGVDELATRLIGADVDLSPLVHDSELALMRTMDGFAELVALAARDRAPYRLTHYAQELAAGFHQFYTNCHILGEEPALMAARLALADACRIVLALTLDLLGVSAPERM